MARREDATCIRAKRSSPFPASLFGSRVCFLVPANPPRLAQVLSGPSHPRKMITGDRKATVMEEA
jgi:hypothetical protein